MPTEGSSLPNPHRPCLWLLTTPRWPSLPPTRRAASATSRAPSSIEVKNKGLINTANSMNDMGGIAHMGGTNNILKIGDAAQVTACGAKQGAGCFYMGGTTLNKVIMEGGINGDAMI
jgi:hypothetical protein